MKWKKMNIINRILNNQLELNDAEDDYGYYDVVILEKIYEDEKGKYKLKEVTYEDYCSCHPETCSHFGGKILKTKQEKIYI